MLENIYKHKLFSPKNYFVLEVIYSSRTAYSLHVHEVVRHKKQFTVNTLETNVSLEDLTRIGVEGKYIALQIRGHVLLEDRIELEDSLNDLSAFNIEQHFGFGQVEDYLISNYFTSNKCYLTAVRKEVVKQWIDDVNANGFQVFSISLGESVLVNYLKGVNLKPSIYQWEGNTYDWDGDYFSVYNGNEEGRSLIDPIAENDDVKSIDQTGLIAFASIISHHYNIGNPKLYFDNSSIKLDEQKEGYFITHFIKKSAMAILPILFLGLLVNFFMFTSYSKEYNTLNETISTNEFKWKIYDNLKQKLEKNKQVLTRQSRLGSLTYYADQIAHLRPYQVTFTKVDIFPLSEKLMTYDVSRDHILIEGLSSNHSQYQAWIKLLDNTEWINTLETIRYKRNVDSGQTTFTLKIEIKNE